MHKITRKDHEEQVDEIIIRSEELPKEDYVIRTMINELDELSSTSNTKSCDEELDPPRCGTKTSI